MTDAFPSYFHVLLDGRDNDGQGSGDVITRDGEVIGTWEADENDHTSFTPNGHQEPLLFNPFLGLLCSEIAAWHTKMEKE